MYLNKFQRDSRFFFDLLASDQISWAKIMYYLYQVAWNIFHTIFNNSRIFFRIFFLKKKIVSGFEPAPHSYIEEAQAAEPIHPHLYLDILIYISLSNRTKKIAKKIHSNKYSSDPMYASRQRTPHTTSFQNKNLSFLSKSCRKIKNKKV